MNKLSSKTKIIAMTSLTIVTLFSAFCASFAWFRVIHPNTDVIATAGNLDIRLTRLSAYRYVYPFFEGSNTYIDYSKEGKVKEFVLSDTDSSENTLPKAETTTELGESLYLVGDKSFLGYEETDTEFLPSSGLKFFTSTDGNTYTISDFTLSSGSIFAIKDSEGKNLKVPLTENKSIQSLDMGYYKATEAGIYDFRIQKNGSAVSFTISKKSRDDNAILGMTVFDPTYALLKGEKGATAIYNQNTCLIFDITLDVENQGHSFSIDSRVKRQSTTAEFPLSKYITYRFLQKDSIPDNKSAFDYFHPEYTDAEEKAGYNTGTDVRKFEDGKDTLELVSSTLSSTSEKTSVRFYIAIDYDPTKIDTFFAESNLGRTYDLPRDFTFFFYVQQVVNNGANK